MNRVIFPINYVRFPIVNLINFVIKSFFLITFLESTLNGKWRKKIGKEKRIKYWWSFCYYWNLKTYNTFYMKDFKPQFKLIFKLFIAILVLTGFVFLGLYIYKSNPSQNVKEKIVVKDWVLKYILVERKQWNHFWKTLISGVGQTPPLHHLC